MKTQHTPGPWTAEKMFNSTKAKDRTCGFVVNGPDSNPLPDRICDMRVPPGLRYAEYKANARIIAAAPELLSALNGTIAHSGESNHLTCSICGKRAAMIKATHCYQCHFGHEFGANHI